MSEKEGGLAGKGRHWSRLHSDDTPNKLLKRIVKAGMPLRDNGTDFERTSARHLGECDKVMYWHRQACRHRVGQSLRQKFLDHLEKKALHCEKKKACLGFTGIR